MIAHINNTGGNEMNKENDFLLSQHAVLSSLKPATDLVSHVGKEIYFLSPEATCVLGKSTKPVIGFSPFNSYYDEGMIRSWLSWVDTYYQEYYLYLPTELSKFNFLSSGYDMRSAVRKTKRQDAYLLNKILRSFDALDISIDRSRLVTTERLSCSLVYKSILNQLIDLYDNNKLFSNILSQASLDFFSKKFNSLDDFQISVEYVIHELPVLLFSSAVLDKKETVFFYNRIPEFIRHLFAFFSQEKRFENVLSPFASLSMLPA